MYIQTAVQRQRLPIVGRLGAARKVVSRLRERIDQVQGQIDPQEFQLQLAANAAAAPPLSAPASAMVPAPSAAPSALGATYAAGAHLCLFLVLIVGGLLSLLRWSLDLSSSGAITVIFWLVMLLEMILAILAVSRQGRGHLSSGLKAIPLLVLLCIVCSYFVALATGGMYGTGQHDSQLILSNLNMALSIPLGLVGSVFWIVWRARLPKRRTGLRVAAPALPGMSWAVPMPPKPAPTSAEEPASPPTPQAGEEP
jgi:hypothetical protein